jgi:hypothetical protein
MMTREAVYGAGWLKEENILIVSEILIKGKEC